MIGNHVLTRCCSTVTASTSRPSWPSRSASPTSRLRSSALAGQSMLQKRYAVLVPSSSSLLTLPQMQEAANNDRDVIVNGIKDNIDDWPGRIVPSDHSLRGWANTTCADYIAPYTCNPADPEYVMLPHPPLLHAHGPSLEFSRSSRTRTRPCHRRSISGRVSVGRTNTPSSTTSPTGF
jgi:hypothetical protein